MGREWLTELQDEVMGTSTVLAALAPRSFVVVHHLLESAFWPVFLLQTDSLRRHRTKSRRRCPRLSFLSVMAMIPYLEYDCGHKCLVAEPV